MADDVVIRAEGLGKKYMIGHRTVDQVPTLRDAVTRAVSNFARSTRDMLSGKPLVSGDEVEEFWALRDVNFEVRRGDVVGIIGRNGAGKSTLLKILSRITEPSEGRVAITGRVASLLEVGTGFHPELSGRENVFLNGAILGMRHAEIKHKFDEIVDFAGVENFIDTPMKRYSSGMQVRLAFAVAAHLDPEILIVDEVLAVGDAEFQKKCLGKIGDISQREGRTVLFVSHQLGLVSRLCSIGLHLSGGKLVCQDKLALVLDSYLDETQKIRSNGDMKRPNDWPYILDIVTLDESGRPTNQFFFDQSILLRVEIHGAISDPRTTLAVTLVPRSGEYLCSEMVDLGNRVGKTGHVIIDIRFPKRVIAPKDFGFRVALFADNGPVFDLHELSAPIKISDNSSHLSKYEKYDYGNVILNTNIVVKHVS